MTEQNLQQEQSVRALQRMLGALSAVHGFLPELVKDGIFGEQTLEAVMLFQRELQMCIRDRPEGAGESGRVAVSDAELPGGERGAPRLPDP